MRRPIRVERRKVPVPIQTTDRGCGLHFAFVANAVDQIRLVSPGRAQLCKPIYGNLSSYLPMLPQVENTHFRLHRVQRLAIATA